MAGVFLAIMAKVFGTDLLYFESDDYLDPQKWFNKANMEACAYFYIGIEKKLVLTQPKNLFPKTLLI